MFVVYSEPIEIVSFYLSHYPIRVMNPSIGAISKLMEILTCTETIAVHHLILICTETFKGIKPLPQTRIV